MMFGSINLIIILVKNDKLLTTSKEIQIKEVQIINVFGYYFL